MSLPLKHTYRFDSFVLDVEEQVLLRDGRQVPMTPKVFDTLLLLVRNQGSLVTKQTILNTLWPDVFVEESNITFNITKVRQALGDTKRPPIYIETVPRRGYRFKSEVKEFLGEDTAVESTSAASEPVTHRLQDEGGRSTSSTAHPASEPSPVTPQLTETQDYATSKRSFAALWIPGRRSALTLSVGAAVVLIVAAAAASWRFNHRFPNRERIDNQQIAQKSTAKTDLKFEQISAYGNVVGAAISPDGKQVVYVQENTGRQSVWLIQLGTLVNIQLIPPGDFSYNKVCFSHDGDYVYFVRHAENQSSDLYRIPTLHGPATKLRENVEGGYSLSADDRKVVFKRRNRAAREDTLFIADFDEGLERPLVTHKEPDWVRGFSLSPNGKVVVYSTGETDSARQTMTIREFNVETGQDRLLQKPNWYFVREMEWLPGGNGLLVLARENAMGIPQLWRMSYPDGVLQKLTDDTNNYLEFSINRDATKMIAVQSVLASHIWVSDMNGRNAKNVADGRGKVIWTGDGHIIYNSGSVLGSDLWITNPDGTDPKQLSFRAGFNDWPAISPDGHTIVFQSNRTGAQHLWRMDLDGGNQMQLTNGYAERSATFSPDGKWVYYNSSENGFLWKIDSNGGEPLQLTNEYAAYPSVSPDGKLIACFHFPTYAHEARITVRNTEDMKQVGELTLAPGFWISRSIQWEADSASVIYAMESNGKLKLYRQAINSGLPELITTLKAEDEFEFTLSPDRKHLAFISTKWNHYALLIDGFRGD